MASMLARMTGDYFKNDGLNFGYDGENDEIIRISFDGTNINTMKFSLFFDDENQNVAVRCFNLGGIKVTEDKRAALINAFNGLNRGYRWAKFYVDDDDNTVTVACDGVIRMDTAGEECHELIMRLCNIIDDEYPTIMKAMWS